MTGPKEIENLAKQIPLHLKAQENPCWFTALTSRPMEMAVATSGPTKVVVPSSDLWVGSPSLKALPVAVSSQGWRNPVPRALGTELV